MSSPMLRSGVNLMAGGDIAGEARWFLTTSDVHSDDDGLGDLIAFVHKCGTTLLSPIGAPA